MSAAPENHFVASLRLFVEIARLRRGPEDLPVSISLLVITVVASFLVTSAYALLLPDQPVSIVGPLLVDLVLTLASIAVLLRIARKPERYVQTTTAIFGFQLVLAPLVVVVQVFAGRFGEDPSWQLPLTLLVIVLGGWSLAVASRIFMSATGWPLLLCIALVLLQELLMWRVVLLLFPEIGSAAPAAA